MWDFSASVGGDNLLSPNETSGARTLSFNNPSNESFTVTFSVSANMPYSGPTCCSPSGSSSSASGGSGGGAGTSGSTPSISSATTLVYQLTYNPLVKSVTVRLIGQ
jgi:hypothetical protein